tara:strand:- start:860 stop:1126 length:267 start_codon:yes stop_codon:yes gene_type:complete
MDNKKNKRFSLKDINMTRHFISRYNERILLAQNGEYSRKAVKKDISQRLTDREKECIDLFVPSNEKVSIPLGQIYTMIIKRGYFITVY